MKKLEPAIQFHNPGNTLSIQYGDRFKKAFEDRRKAYLNEFSELLFSTFDKPVLAKLEFSFKDKIIYNERGLNSLLYAFLMPFIHREKFSKAKYYFALQVPASLYPFWCSLFFRGKRVCVLWNYDWIEMSEKIGKSKSYILFVKLWTWLTLKLINYYVVTNETDKKKILASKPNAKIALFPTAVDTEIFKPLHRQRKPNSFIFVGRLTYQKNLENLISAVSEIKGAELHIVGDGEDREKLEIFSQTLKTNVIFHGRKKTDEIIELLNTHSFFILPSHFEGVSNALVEAMACGIPVIASDIYTNREIIKHGENGWLCGRDKESIKESMLYALAHTDEAKKCADNALQMIQENFSVKKYFQRLAEFISKK